MLRLEGVTKVFKAGTFGGKRIAAVSDVSFEIRPGEIVSLIGESGSGKTTIGKLVLRLADVTEGSIVFGDQDVTEARRPQPCAATTRASRASSRIRSARITRSSRPTGCST